MPPDAEGRVVEIHVSDRNLFRRCRRKWDFRSHLRQNLQPIDELPNPNLWFGSGYHYALEDWHGYRHFSRASDAFRAYADACGHREFSRPENWEALCELADGMLDYYTDHWLRRRKDFHTWIVDGVPQVEVPFRIRLFDDLYGNVVEHCGTFDRMVEDNYGRLFICEYKTAKTVNTEKLVNDAQVNAYAWAADQIWPNRVEGVVYIQFAKQVPKLPRVLLSGELSLDARAKTTYSIYRAALVQKFGGVPKRYRDFLDTLAAQETPEGDGFIRQDIVRRNEYSLQAEDRKIRDEIMDMLSPDLRIYPNPTQDCSWDCPFRTPCIAMDSGYDLEDILNLEFTEAASEEERSWWRQYVKYPTTAAEAETEVASKIHLDLP